MCFWSQRRTEGERQAERESLEVRGKKEEGGQTYAGTGADGGVWSEQPATTRQNPAANPPTETRASTEPRSLSRSGRRGAAGGRPAAPAGAAASGKGGMVNGKQK